jgi:recombination protein RecA
MENLAPSHVASPAIDSSSEDAREAFSAELLQVDRLERMRSDLSRDRLLDREAVSLSPAADLISSSESKPDGAAVPAWSLGLLEGRLCELVGDLGAPLLTVATSLVLQAQQRRQPVAWIVVGESIFHPSDVADWGVDLAALPVLKVSDVAVAARAADVLLRSGAFGLIVLDLGVVSVRARIPVGMQTRLMGLVRRHRAALLCLSRSSKEQTALGSLVSLRAQTVLQRSGASRFRCKVEVIKDKRAGAGLQHVEECVGPEGLR